MEMILEDRNCIKVRRLLEAAAGLLKPEEAEQRHLHECQVCQGVFYIFIRQHTDFLVAASMKRTSAA